MNLDNPVGSINEWTSPSSAGLVKHPLKWVGVHEDRSWTVTQSPKIGMDVKVLGDLSSTRLLTSIDKL